MSGHKIHTPIAMPTNSRPAITRLNMALTNLRHPPLRVKLCDAEREISAFQRRTRVPPNGGRMAEKTKERHPLRFLFKVVVLGAFVYFAGRLVMMKKDEYYGLTESEARSKITDKLGKRVGPEKAAEVADQVIPLLKDRGVVKPDPVSEAASDLADAMAEAEDDVEKAMDDMVEATEADDDSEN